MSEDIVECLAELLMLRDFAPFPRVWKGKPRLGRETDSRGGEWETYTPVCSEAERVKWRGEARRFLIQLREARLEISRPTS